MGPIWSTSPFLRLYAGTIHESNTSHAWTIHESNPEQLLAFKAPQVGWTSRVRCGKCTIPIRNNSLFFMAPQVGSTSRVNELSHPWTIHESIPEQLRVFKAPQVGSMSPVNKSVHNLGPWVGSMSLGNWSCDLRTNQRPQNKLHWAESVNISQAVNKRTLAVCVQNSDLILFNYLNINKFLYIGCHMCPSM